MNSGYNSAKTSGQWFNMNNASGNIGGWQSTLMRTVTMPLIKAAFPADLQAVIKGSTIYTDNTGGSSQTLPTPTATQDEVFLLAEYEIFGKRSYANALEANYQQQYAYYAAGNSKVKYKHNTTGSTAWWWGRSPLSGNSNDFCRVYTDGGAHASTAYYSFGVSPAFKI